MQAELHEMPVTAWSYNCLAACGVEFEPGQVILPGSCLEAVRMDAPGAWTGEFDGWASLEFEASSA